jgi:hypothetical protein
MKQVVLGGFTTALSPYPRLSTTHPPPLYKYAHPATGGLRCNTHDQSFPPQNASGGLREPDLCAGDLYRSKPLHRPPHPSSRPISCAAQLVDRVDADEDLMGAKTVRTADQQYRGCRRLLRAWSRSRQIFSACSKSNLTDAGTLLMLTQPSLHT